MPEALAGGEPSEAVRLLASAANVINIGFTDLVVRRSAKYSDAAFAEGVDVSPTYTLEVGRGAASSTDFSVSLRVQIDTLIGEIMACVIAKYEVEDFPPENLVKSVLVEYANEVGVMTLLPYLRQAVADLTQRVFETPLLMPVMPRGQLTFEEDISAIGPS